MKIIFRSFDAILLTVVGLFSVVLAGGPTATRNGAPVRYNNASPITYKTDQGPMGSFTNTVATNLTINSFQTWQNVSTAQISFTNGGQLPVDVTSANYTTYIDNFTDGINPMIFDSDGSLVEAMLGSGSSNTVIGFAGSSYFTSGPNEGKYAEGQAVMNGKFANNPFTEAQFKSTFVHEFGHFIGLDHSQINSHMANDNNKSNEIYIPTMYPTSTDDDVPLGDLNPDDIAAVSLLYPASNFATSTGKISGTVTRFDNSAALGVNVVAFSTGSDSLMNRISTVTDYYKQNSGAFTLVGLAPGNYYVFIEPIKTSFIEGSSVGPYAGSASDLSFVNPVSMEYWNAGNESWDPSVDDASAKTAVAVSANATTSNINIVANKIGNAPQTSILQYHFGLSGVFKLPSQYADSRYAVRFTPASNAKFLRTEFYINGSNNAISGNGTLKVSMHQNTAGSLGGIPGAQIGTAVNIPFAQITKGTYNTVNFSSQNLPVTANTNFHMVFEVVGGAGDTLQFVTDDGSNSSDRSSSYFNNAWVNIKHPTNYGIGYNLAIRAVVEVPASVKEEALFAETFSLSQNYPNPFNPSTTIAFSIPVEGLVTVKVFTLLGEEVTTLVQEHLMSGAYSTSFDGSKLSSGMYFYTITAGEFSQTKKMLLLK